MPRYRERPNLGWYWIQSDDKHIGFLDGKLGRNFPRVIDGYAKYSEQERRRRRSPIIWDGSPPLRVTFDILFAGATSASRVTDSVENDIRRLEKMAGLVSDGYEPPQLEWAANGPHDYFDAPQNSWALEELVWSDDENDYHWNSDGNRTQAYATITLATITEVSFIQADVPTIMRDKKAANKKKNSGGAKSASNKTYTVQPGDNLSKIASRQLGSSSRYPEIAELNNIRDPSDVTVGQVLKMP